MIELGGVAVTAMPAAAVGFCSAPQPLAGAMLTVGIAFDSGSGSVGFGPLPAWIGCLLEVPPQACEERQSDQEWERSERSHRRPPSLQRSVSAAAHLDVAMRFEAAAQVLILALAQLLRALDRAIAQLAHDPILVFRGRNHRAEQCT